MDYIQHVSKNPSVFIAYLLILIFIVFLISSNKDNSLFAKFIIIAFGVIACATLYNKDEKRLAEEKKAHLDFDTKIALDKRKSEMMFKNIYSLHRKPLNTKEISGNQQIIKVFNGLTKVARYTGTSYEDLVYLVEHFLKQSSKIYDNQSFQTLHDIRMEILNTFTEFYINTPERFHPDISKAKLKLEGITYKKMQTIAKKLKLQAQAKPPYSFDPNKSPHDVF